MKKIPNLLRKVSKKKKPGDIRKKKLLHHCLWNSHILLLHAGFILLLILYHIYLQVDAQYFVWDVVKTLSRFI